MARYRALTDLSLRRSADRNDPAYEEWHDWPADATFEAPLHMDVEAALRMLNDVITKAPLFAHAHYNRGVLLARTGRCDEGVREAQVAIALDASFQEFACAPGSR